MSLMNSGQCHILVRFVPRPSSTPETFSMVPRFNMWLIELD